MILKDLKNKKITNVVIFVCDSLRWDYTPQSILDMGVAIKTIASSLYTAPSFPSIISGLYPPKTGVNNWQDKISKYVKGLINFKDYNISLWCETTWTNFQPWESDIHRVLGNPKGEHLKEIKQPFIYIEDDKGGHAPYGISFGIYKSFYDFYKDYGKKGKEQLIKQYEKGIDQSVNRLVFHKQLLQNPDILVL